ncbi:MAG TPA: glycoside hydrolase family 3 N-terminal domain-containing protein, partial [Gaiellales bacterium]|nr:glycoside hydrolase family 3 N-terminal domain-containing protein [Gaiellales bacterium]
VDQEGGEVKRLSGPPNRSPTQLAAAGSGAAEAEGAATGRYLSGLGINVDLAPVLDVPAPGSFIASRTFGSTPAGVARVGGAFAAGLEAGGAAATLKHFPGLGRATANTDTGSSSVGASRSTLRRDMTPFGAAIGGGASLVMMSSASYPSLAAGPAVLSPAIVQGELRQRLGFDGVVVTDDLEGGAVRAVMPPGAAAVAAAKAGVDMVLYAQRLESGTAAYEALYSAARSGRLDRSQLERSYARIQQVQSGAG